MILGARAGTVGGVRPFLLVVLFGLFALHVLTAHGASHHQGPVLTGPVVDGASHHQGLVLTGPIVDGASAGASSHLAPAHRSPSRDELTGSAAHPSTEPMSGARAQAVPAAVVAILPVATTAAAVIGPAGSAGSTGLLMCWLLLSAGIGVVVGALLWRRSPVGDVRRLLLGCCFAGGSAPRAPPGRRRLHELVVLRV